MEYTPTIDQQITAIQIMRMRFEGDKDHFIQGTYDHQLLSDYKAIEESLISIKRWNESPMLHNVDVEKVIKNLIQYIKGTQDYKPDCVQNAEAALGMIQAFKSIKETKIDSDIREYPYTLDEIGLMASAPGSKLSFPPPIPPQTKTEIDLPKICCYPTGCCFPNCLCLEADEFKEKKKDPAFQGIVDTFKQEEEKITLIHHELHHSNSVLQKFQKSDEPMKILEAANIMIACLKAGGKIISCGNGGSFSDAQHFVSELTGRYREDRDPIAAIALSDGGAITCIGNDFGYEDIFARQVRGLGKEGDVLLCLSTSGKSLNVINAAFSAVGRGVKVVYIAGGDVDLLGTVIRIPHHGTADRIQEVTIIVIHILVNLIEKGLGYTKNK